MSLVSRLRALWRRRRGSSGSDEPAAKLPALGKSLGKGTGARFSFITSAYNTPPEFLLELADSIANQNEAGAEWVLVDNGSTVGATRECLQQLASRPGVRAIRTEKNAGILGGMLLGLQAATREFSIPVDSDDLLAPYTIRALGHALLAQPGAKFLFSDEDHYTDGRRVNPFYRVGWDPALALACSYIWHLCAFDRETAMRLGCYADPGANYCHDWDTLLRFVRAGHRPVHVPAVLYSWRTHSSSTTNNETEAHSGSLDSQRHVLNLYLQDRDLVDRFAVADCPLWRGAPELRLERQARDLPELDLIVYDSRGTVSPADVDRVVTELGRQVTLRHRVRYEDGAALAALRREPAFAVLVCDAAVQVREPDAVAELVGWLELLPEAALVGGRLIDDNNRVVSAGYFPSPKGGLAAPDAGRGDTDPGYLAMALKPRVVAGIPPGLALARGGWFAQHDLAAARTPGAELLGWLSFAATQEQLAVVCTPFVTCVGRPGSALRGEPGPQVMSAFSQRGIWHGAHGMP